MHEFLNMRPNKAVAVKFERQSHLPEHQSFIRMTVAFGSGYHKLLLRNFDTSSGDVGRKLRGGNIDLARPG